MPGNLPARVGQRKAAARLERYRRLKWEAELRANKNAAMRRLHGPPTAHFKR